MKVSRLLCILSATLLFLPGLSYAEIYKWKDKDGVTRYTDTPPPSNIKQESIGKKKVVKPADSLPSATEPQAAPVAPKPVAIPKEVVNPEEEAAKLRQRNAEIEKNNKQEKEAQTKLKAENCKAARANYETYAQGGRVYKTNESGDREYLGDKELQESANKAQAEINENCN
ncbi:MAG: DUF4124 domain-containing protein [Methylophilaceae bacterium]